MYFRDQVFRLQIQAVIDERKFSIRDNKLMNNRLYGLMESQEGSERDEFPVRSLLKLDGSILIFFVDKDYSLCQYIKEYVV